MRSHFIAAMMAKNPAVYYLCDEVSGALQDSSGNGRHTTSGSAAGYRQNGPLGVGDYGIVHSGATAQSRSAAFLSATNNITLMGYFQTQIAGGAANLLWGPLGSGYEVWWRNTGKVCITLFGVANMADSAAVFSGGSTWRHFAGVREAGTWKYYVNFAVDTANAGTTAPVMPSTTLGINNTDVQCGYAHLAVYENAWTESEISALGNSITQPDFVPKVLMM